MFVYNILVSPPSHSLSYIQAKADNFENLACHFRTYNYKYIYVHILSEQFITCSAIALQFSLIQICKKCKMSNLFWINSIVHINNNNHLASFLWSGKLYITLKEALMALRRKLVKKSENIWIKLSGNEHTTKHLINKFWLKMIKICHRLKFS